MAFYIPLSWPPPVCLPYADCRLQTPLCGAQLEAWAVGVMDLVEEQEIAHLILSHTVEAWRMGCAA